MLVIIGDRSDWSATTGIGGRATLDGLLRATAARCPDAIALSDPPNRESFTDGGPRQLTYAQADRMVSAIAGRLRRIGLPTDSVVGLQMANTVDGVLTLLGVLRAGLIAMPLPLLWRRADAVSALSRVGVHALVVSGRVGAVDHFDLAMRVAAEIFAVRHVCGFGNNAPDGVILLDDLFTTDQLDPVPSRERAGEPGAGAPGAGAPGAGEPAAGEPGAHLALITWDVSADGLVPVARSHAELIAGGVAVLLEGKFKPDPVILSTLMMSSFAGIAVAIVPWLLVGGTLVLHQPFDPATFAAQCRKFRCDTILVPGPLLAALAEAGHLSEQNDIKRVIGLWRTPERLPRAPVWPRSDAALTDVHVFGEIGLIAARREPNGQPAALPIGTLFAPRGAERGFTVAEIMQTTKGTVALRGPMVPQCVFPPGAERTELPHLKIAPTGFVDTDYPCQVDRDTNAMTVSGSPSGIVGVGGYRFVLRHMQDLVGLVENDGTLVALPDALAGQRLAGIAGDRWSIRDGLTGLGVNPLLVEAFRDPCRDPYGDPCGDEARPAA